MATTKSSPPQLSETTDGQAPTADQAQVSPPPVDLDFTESDTWGKGGRFVIDQHGQRVPADPQ